jgi:predicted transcriptional regulator
LTVRGIIMDKKTDGIAVRQNPTNPPQTVGVTKKRWVVCFENTILGLDLSIYEKMVYIALCSHAKKDGPCYPSVKKIAQEASCSRTKVFEALKTLEERGVIVRSSQIYKGRGQTSNLYEIIDIIPRPQDGQESTAGEPPHPCGGRGSARGECPPFAACTGGVREADAVEQGNINNPIRTIPKNSPPTPWGGRGELEIQESPKNENGTGQKSKSTETPASPEPPISLEILGAYNAILPELPEAGGLTASRLREIEARIRDDPARKNLDWWKRYFLNVREFPWPMGDNPNGWRADFDWLVSGRGMRKIIEGGFQRSLEPGGGTKEGYELQKKYTNEEGLVDVWGLLDELRERERAAGAF